MSKSSKRSKKAEGKMGKKRKKEVLSATTKRQQRQSSLPKLKLTPPESEESAEILIPETRMSGEKHRKKKKRSSKLPEVTKNADFSKTDATVKKKHFKAPETEHSKSLKTAESSSREKLSKSPEIVNPLGLSEKAETDTTNSVMSVSEQAEQDPSKSNSSESAESKSSSESAKRKRLKHTQKNRKRKDENPESYSIDGDKSGTKGAISEGKRSDTRGEKFDSEEDSVSEQAEQDLSRSNSSESVESKSSSESAKRKLLKHTKKNRKRKDENPESYSIDGDKSGTKGAISEGKKSDTRGEKFDSKEGSVSEQAEQDLSRSVESKSSSESAKRKRLKHTKKKRKQKDENPESYSIDGDKSGTKGATSKGKKSDTRGEKFDSKEDSVSEQAEQDLSRSESVESKSSSESAKRKRLKHTKKNRKRKDENPKSYSIDGDKSGTKGATSEGKKSDTKGEKLDSKEDSHQQVEKEASQEEFTVVQLNIVSSLLEMEVKPDSNQQKEKKISQQELVQGRSTFGVLKRKISGSLRKNIDSSSTEETETLNEAIAMKRFSSDSYVMEEDGEPSFTAQTNKGGVRRESSFTAIKRKISGIFKDKKLIGKHEKKHHIDKNGRKVVDSGTRASSSFTVQTKNFLGRKRDIPSMKDRHKESFEQNLCVAKCGTVNKKSGHSKKNKHLFEKNQQLIWHRFSKSLDRRPREQNKTKFVEDSSPKQQDSSNKCLDWKAREHHNTESSLSDESFLNSSLSKPQDKRLDQKARDSSVESFLDSSLSKPQDKRLDQKARDSSVESFLDSSLSKPQDKRLDQKARDSSVESFLDSSLSKPQDRVNKCLDQKAREQHNTELSSSVESSLSKPQDRVNKRLDQKAREQHNTESSSSVESFLDVCLPKQQDKFNKHLDQEVRKQHVTKLLPSQSKHSITSVVESLTTSSSNDDTIRRGKKVRRKTSSPLVMPRTSTSTKAPRARTSVGSRRRLITKSASSLGSIQGEIELSDDSDEDDPPSRKNKKRSGFKKRKRFSRPNLSVTTVTSSHTFLSAVESQTTIDSGLSIMSDSTSLPAKKRLSAPQVTLPLTETPESKITADNVKDSGPQSTGSDDSDEYFQSDSKYLDRKSHGTGKQHEQKLSPSLKRKQESGSSRENRSSRVSTPDASITTNTDSQERHTAEECTPDPSIATDTASQERQTAEECTPDPFIATDTASQERQTAEECTPDPSIATDIASQKKCTSLSAMDSLKTVDSNPSISDDKSLLRTSPEKMGSFQIMPPPTESPRARKMDYRKGRNRQSSTSSGRVKKGGTKKVRLLENYSQSGLFKHSSTSDTADRQKLPTSRQKGDSNMRNATSSVNTPDTAVDSQKTGEQRAKIYTQNILPSPKTRWEGDPNKSTVSTPDAVSQKLSAVDSPKTIDSNLLSSDDYSSTRRPVKSKTSSPRVKPLMLDNIGKGSISLSGSSAVSKENSGKVLPQSDFKQDKKADEPDTHVAQSSHEPRKQHKKELPPSPKNQQRTGLKKWKSSNASTPAAFSQKELSTEASQKTVDSNFTSNDNDSSLGTLSRKRPSSPHVMLSSKKTPSARILADVRQSSILSSRSSMARRGKKANDKVLSQNDSLAQERTLNEADKCLVDLSQRSQGTGEQNEKKLPPIKICASSPEAKQLLQSAESSLKSSVNSSGNSNIDTSSSKRRKRRVSSPQVMPMTSPAAKSHKAKVLPDVEGGRRRRRSGSPVRKRISSPSIQSEQQKSIKSSVELKAENEMDENRMQALYDLITKVKKTPSLGTERTVKDGTLHEPALSHAKSQRRLSKRTQKGKTSDLHNTSDCAAKKDRATIVAERHVSSTDDQKSGAQSPLDKTKSYSQDSGKDTSQQNLLSQASVRESSDSKLEVATTVKSPGKQDSATKRHRVSFAAEGSARSLGDTDHEKYADTQVEGALQKSAYLPSTVLKPRSKLGRVGTAGAHTQDSATKKHEAFSGADIDSETKTKARGTSQEPSKISLHGTNFERAITAGTKDIPDHTTKNRRAPKKHRRSIAASMSRSGSPRKILVGAYNTSDGTATNSETKAGAQSAVEGTSAPVRLSRYGSPRKILEKAVGVTGTSNTSDGTARITSIRHTTGATSQQKGDKKH